jgi:hypothetical protein
MNEFEDIHALADGQIEGEAKAAAAARILSDEAARAEYETVTLLKATLVRACEPVPNPEGWKDVRERLDAIDRTRRAEVFVGRNAWALCAVFFVLIVSAAFFNRATGRNKLYTGDVARVMSSMVPMPLGSSSDVEQGVQSALGMVPFRVPAEGLRPTGFSKGLLDGNRAVMVNFLDSRGPTVLLVIENKHEVEGLRRDPDELGYSVGKLNGINAIAWECDGRICILVGERDFEDLQQVATHVRASD